MRLSERTLDRIRSQLDYDANAKQLLSQEEIIHMEVYGELDQVCDGLYIPNENSDTYKITKMCRTNLNLCEFIDKIIETVLFPYEIILEVGFFVNDETDNLCQYIKPCIPSSLMLAHLSSLESYWKFKEELQYLNEDILSTAYDNAIKGNHITTWLSPSSATLICIYITPK